MVNFSDDQATYTVIRVGLCALKQDKRHWLLCYIRFFVVLLASYFLHFHFAFARSNSTPPSISPQQPAVNKLQNILLASELPLEVL
jgi:hypothetical protein